MVITMETSTLEMQTETDQEMPMQVNTMETIMGLEMQVTTMETTTETSTMETTTETEMEMETLAMETETATETTTESPTTKMFTASTSEENLAAGSEKLMYIKSINISYYFQLKFTNLQFANFEFQFSLQFGLS